MNIIRRLLLKVTQQSDSDLADKFNYHVTAVGLILTQIVVTSWSFTGSPIQCVLPQSFTKQWTQYVLSYCYTQNDLFGSLIEAQTTSQKSLYETVDARINDTAEMGRYRIGGEVHKTCIDLFLGYYHSVPVILLFESVSFYLPIVIWRTFSNALGVNLIMLCDSLDAINMEERKKQIRIIAGYINRKRILKKMKPQDGLPKGSNWIVCSYLLMKLMFIGNVVGQSIFLKMILGMDSYSWGFYLTESFASKHDNRFGAKHFPKEAWCRYDVRSTETLNTEVVQCFLNMNAVNEKIFAVIWWWLCFLLVLNLVSFLQWLRVSFSYSATSDFINPHVVKIDPSMQKNSGKLFHFTSTFLSFDTVLLIRLIEINNGKIMVAEIVQELWAQYLRDLPYEFETLPTDRAELAVTKNRKHQINYDV